MTVFVFDASYPTQDVALRLTGEPHLFIANRPLDPPAGQGSLLLSGRFAVDRRRLRAAWRDGRSLIIAGRQTRPEQLLYHAVQALLLGGPVALFDGETTRPLGRCGARLSRAALALLARATIAGPRAYLKDRQLRRQAPPGPEGALYGRHTRAGSFSLPPDRIAPLPPGPSLYGRWTGGWYLPTFSHAAERHAVTTTRHRLRDVALHVEEIAGGEVSSLFQDGRILSYPYMIGAHPILHTYAVTSRRTVTTIERGVALLYFTAGYYHWIIEGIPRVLDVLDDGIDLDRTPLILPPLESYQREFLALMGIDPARQVVTVDRGDWCHVADCLFPTAYFPFTDIVENPSGRPDATVLRRIAARVLDRLPPAPEGPRRIYVSRAAAAKRKLTPEAEAALVAALEPLGFRRIVMEEFTWPEQVRLFAGAELIVGMHGAGLANLPFSRARALIEILNPMEARAYFATIARELGMEYATLVAGRTGRAPRFDDLTIDPADVTALVRRMTG
jgi:capsular polysaccharide biosynthesis protein